VALLGSDRQGCDRARFEASQRDRLAGLLAIAVGTIVDALQGSIDLADQLALTIARPQLDRPLRLRGGAIGESPDGFGFRPANVAASLAPPSGYPPSTPATCCGNIPAAARS